MGKLHVEGTDVLYGGKCVRVTSFSVQGLQNVIALLEASTKF